MYRNLCYQIKSNYKVVELTISVEQNKKNILNSRKPDKLFNLTNQSKFYNWQDIFHIRVFPQFEILKHNPATHFELGVFAFTRAFYKIWWLEHEALQKEWWANHSWFWNQLDRIEQLKGNDSVTEYHMHDNIIAICLSWLYSPVTVTSSCSKYIQI